MNWKYTSFLTFGFLFWTLTMYSQITCTYQLELFDSGGDGWDGASITISINGDPTVYTLNGVEDNGAFRSFDIQLSTGDLVVVSYTSGISDRENSYSVYDPDGRLLFSDGPGPTPGMLPPVNALCPSCPAPDQRSISLDDVRGTYADISWLSSDPDGRNIVEYGLAGFDFSMGSRVETRGSMIRLQGLDQKTDYEFYLFSICSNGDTSLVQGPFPFQTLWNVDVGISDILRPVSNCGLLFMDTVQVALTNFGGLPQTLIPFRYSVNGVDAGVNIPFDGFFTGSLGKDSTSFIDFETTFNFGAPGDYEITAWSELETDSDLSNDTTTITITNIPVVTVYPYYENFEEWSGGWTVDSNSVRPSWAHGRPEGAVINRAAGGDRAWVTNLSGKYNSGERSYLLSPCLDFSGLREDPRLSFSRMFVTEECCDSVWVEVSTDGGENWRKVGTAGTGLNWYNKEDVNVWGGDESDRGWVYAFNILEGTAGASDVRIRFAFSSDNGLEEEGFGLDNVFIGNPLTNDLAATGVSNASDLECGDENDRIVLTISNFGTRLQRTFDVGYRVNGGPAVIENIGNLPLQPDGSAAYTFNTPFNSSGATTYDIVAWTSLPSDEFRSNDTIRFTLTTARNLPFVEDFESGVVPPGWDAGDAIVTDQRNNTSYVLADNLFSGDRDFVASTPVIGPLGQGDSLTFDYRLTLQGGGGLTPKELAPGEKLEVQISTDCGQTFNPVLVIDQNDHEPSAEMKNVTVRLDPYEGESIKIRFVANWVAGDWWVDIDNVNILRCPASLQLTSQVGNESASGAMDGSATVIPGDGFSPFTYLWSTGDTTKTISNLSADVYQVTVTDRFGCSDAALIEVGVGTSLEDIPAIRELTLAPNPTSGMTRLQISFLNVADDVYLQLIDMVGRPMLEIRRRNITYLEEEIDLSRYSGGVYFLRVMVDDQMHSEKILLIK